MDPEDLAFLMVSLCIDHQNRGKTGYEGAMNFPRKSLDFGVRQTLTLPSPVTLDKLLNFSEPNF